MLQFNERFIKCTLHAFCVFPQSCQKTIFWEIVKNIYILIYSVNSHGVEENIWT